MSEKTQFTIGTILDESAARDAIHIAVAPVVAAVRLKPGQDVGLRPGTDLADSSESAIGIVDPFLKSAVKTGERFWMFLYPNTITSLRHEWAHPSFPEEGGEDARRFAAALLGSEKWLRDFANHVGKTYEALIAGARNYLHNGDYIHLGIDTPDYEATGFWEHYEAVTGEQVPEQKRNDHIFTCAC